MDPKVQSPGAEYQMGYVTPQTTGQVVPPQPGQPIQYQQGVPPPVYQQQPQPQVQPQAQAYGQPNAYGPPQHQATGFGAQYGIAPDSYGVPLVSLAAQPAPVQCPNCHQRVMTAVSYESGGFTHLMALLACCVVCLGCIPYLIASLKDVHHKCPNCNAPLATYHRSGRTEVHFQAAQAAAASQAAAQQAPQQPIQQQPVQPAAQHPPTQ
ncbi:hypothetical protein SAPIO_CDS8690 [Scedosporium apiospermum]|uniref:LITAF domain-containing protein n=1 Tax=Pseudallescheria apiosperma TaxID=563466 RepID=A0A084G079_PSEDA|nr:uncharacterized protein SAPIO_CDS8690 [Scedosporium apiospermum]KEZ40741.1 hypothetical protein SAPIO_CDS8690 [Scedosporium apiospermum]